jgi:hypothetical protein
MVEELEERGVYEKPGNIQATEMETENYPTRAGVTRHRLHLQALRGA